MNNVLIIRSVYGKVNQIYYIEPCPNPRTGRLPQCVKTVNSDGDMILSEKEVAAMNAGTVHFIPAGFTFEIIDGKTYDLDDLVQAAEWEAIEHCNWIAKDRYERNANGELIIDGGAKRYGVAELYVDRPGEVAASKVSKKRLVTRANTYVFDDTESNLVKKAKVMGRDLSRANPSDVVDYLTEIAERNPQKIINLYEGEDWKIHLFILEAIERGVIRLVDTFYKYDDKILGASLESTMIFLKDLRYKAILNSIKKETYPDYMSAEEQAEASQAAMAGIIGK